MRWSARLGHRLSPNVRELYNLFQADPSTAEGLKTIGTEKPFSETGEKAIVEGLLNTVLDDRELTSQYGRRGPITMAFTNLARGLELQQQTPQTLTERARSYINRMIGRDPALRPIG